MTETARTAVAFVKLLHNPELHLLNRHEDHLRDAFGRLYLVALRAAIPARYVHLALVVRIYQARQVAEHKAMLVAEA